MGLVDVLSLTLTRRMAEDSRPSYFLPSFLPWDCRVIEVHSCWTLQLLLPWTLDFRRRPSTYRYIVGQSVPLTFLRTSRTSRNLFSQVDNLVSSNQLFG